MLLQKTMLFFFFYTSACRHTSLITSTRYHSALEMSLPEQQKGHPRSTSILYTPDVCEGGGLVSRGEILFYFNLFTCDQVEPPVNHQIFLLPCMDNQKEENSLSFLFFRGVPHLFLFCLGVYITFFLTTPPKKVI